MKPVFVSLVTMLAAAAAPAHAASPFDGTWKADVASAQLPKKPFVTLLKDGIYTCSSCIPKFTVKADGAFHRMTGMPYVDEASVKVVDATTVVETDKWKGKVVGTSTTKVAPGGRTALFEWTDSSAPDGKTQRGEGTQTRVGPAPAGAHAVSGTWRTAKVSSMSDGAATMRLKASGNHFAMTTPNGYSYDAVIGGPAVPIVGDIANTMVKIARIDAMTMAETDLRGGVPVQTFRFTALPGGKAIRMAVTNVKQGTTTVVMLNRQ